MEICQYIVGKNKNALETGRKTIVWKLFHPVLQRVQSEFYIFRQCMRIVFILHIQKTQDNCQIVWKEQ
jgi:hypothetical protein